MPKVTLSGCDILEFESRSYQGRDGTQKQFRSVMFRYEGKIFKLGVERDLQSQDVESARDAEQKVDLVCALSTFGDKLEPSLRIAEIA